VLHQCPHKLGKILAKLDEEKDQAKALELMAERTRLMKMARGYLVGIE
jgi:hypothetical protein